MSSVGIFMGIEVYLLGVDFSYDIPKESRKLGSGVIVSGNNNYFIEGYREKGEKWNMPMLHHQKKAYYSAKRAFLETTEEFIMLLEVEA